MGEISGGATFFMLIISKKHPTNKKNYPKINREAMDFVLI
jgi:hypothetical protein